MYPDKYVLFFMKGFLIIIFCFSSIASFAQTEKVYKIKAGQLLSDVLSFYDIYKDSSFRVGTVFFRDGRTSNAFLNYNYLNGEMDFIDVSGDTISIAEEQTIKLISIKKDSFFYDNGYLYLLQSNGYNKLAVKKEIQLINKERPGAFDQTVMGSADVFGGFSDKRHVKLVVKEDLALQLKTMYFFGNRNKFY
ncbi:MAG: hypothetical protein ACR2KB_14590 [Chitinophagaceae bacterium]